MSKKISNVKYYGIDLGFTNSRIAHIDEFGRPAVIPNSEGSRITPSVVFFDGENQIVGMEAKKLSHLHPDQVVDGVKRIIGQSDRVFFYNGIEFTPEVIASYMLRKIVRDAEQFLHCQIKDVVIACPAYFGNYERESIIRAGEIAGLNVRSIISESVAATLSYGLDIYKEDRIVLVYDLGGGGFDVALVEIMDGEISIIASGGDHYLGSRNWDESVVNYLAEEWKNLTRTQEEPLDDPETVQGLFLKAEQAKISLTAREKTIVTVTHAGESQKVVLTREKMDELTAGLLERTIEYTRMLLDEARKQGYTKFDRILLVGGATRMPQVHKRLKQEFRMEPISHDPDEAVAKGAAWYGQKLAIEDAIKLKIEGWGFTAEENNTAIIESAQLEVADELGLLLQDIKKYENLNIKHISQQVPGNSKSRISPIGHAENQILQEIQEALKQNAKQLDLRGWGLQNIPPEIGLIKSLEVLILDSNPIVTLPPEIGKLDNLKVLSARYCSITFLPNELWFLENLHTLRLGSNRIDSISEDIINLANLSHLSVWGNPLKRIPNGIFSLTNLRILNISQTGLKVLPDAIGKLKKLQVLGIDGNQLQELSYGIKNLTNLRELYAYNNPLPIPPEITAKVNQPKAIIDYVFSISASKRILGESKILVIGQGSVGKTSILRRIIHNSFNSVEDKTEGIAVSHWTVDIASSQNETEYIRLNGQPIIQLNIWDFGGQEIMHATHQFFLTKRSLYLLVLDSRLTQEENRVEYWLKIIQSFGGESPVLIVGNKIDQHPLDIDRTGLQKKYPNIVGILETSAATGAGIEGLKAAITEQVNNLPHIRDLLPETWFTVKTKLEELGKQSNFITQEKYLDLCTENEVSDETSQRTLIGFLHDLGVVLHFQDDPRLEALGILNPQWVTNGVYKILNSDGLFRNKGVLTISMLDEILNLPEYPRGKRLFIVDMMKKFELCYDIESDKTFLVPDLLPKDQPDLKFSGVPAFEYAYPVLPSSVITRFIVRMNQKIDDGLVWRTGVVLKIGENKALVKADIEDRKITIAIDGLEHTRRDALSAIRFQLDEIHGSIKGLNPEKRVPIPEAPNAEPLKYDYLLMLERAGQEFHLVQDGTKLVKVNVREILSGVESESQRREPGGNVTNIYIGGDVKGGTIISGDNNLVFTQRIQESVKKAESSSIPPELLETLKLLGEAVDLMNKVLPKENAAETTEDFDKLVDEATKPAPNRKWYSVSIEGLIKAAENVEKVGEPVINLSRKVLSLLTGGAVK